MGVLCYVLRVIKTTKQGEPTVLNLRRLIVCIVTLLTFSTVNAAPQSPTNMFGFTPGDDYKLASYEQQKAFYQQLARESDRVQIREIGRSVLDQPLYLLTISSPGNLARLDHFRDISTQLARGRIDKETAASLAQEGKAIVWIDAGLHATELAVGQMAPSLAWRLATETSPEMQQILDEVIVLFMPMMNPDGLEIVRKWYDSQLGTAWEATNPPELYHHYVGHDNNRDFFMNNMPESKAVAEVIYNEWHPQIVVNHHQISPAWARIVIPPYSDPINPIIHPGVTTGLNEVGAAMGNRFALKGMPGAIADVGFSMWWNGGMRTVPYYHNMIGILTETGHNWPTPTFYDPTLFPRMRALRANRGAIGTELKEDEDPIPPATVLYPDPWEGGESHFGDAVQYVITSSLAVLRAAADGREKWQTNMHHMAQDAIAAGSTGTRYYIIPAGQRHDDEAHNLVNVLREGGVEISRATESFRADGERYATGSFLIPSAQAFRPYVIDLLEKQTYPDNRVSPDAPKKQPYDITGWTLPFQMGVTVVTTESDLNVESDPVSANVTYSGGSVSGNASYGYALSRAMNASVTAINTLLEQGERVSVAGEGFRAGGQRFAPGTFVIAAGDDTADRVEALAESSGMRFVGLRSEPDSLASLTRPRVGLYKSYVASMDEGWTRWMLEDFNFDVVSLSDSDLRRGNLDSLDAIILPHPDGGAYFQNDIAKILNGHPQGTMPEAYTGGMGLAGALSLERFVRAGGTLLAFGSANDFAIHQFGLPIRNAVGSASSDTFSIPGSIIDATVDTNHPLAYGMPERVALTVVRGAAFRTVGQKNCIDDLLNQRHCIELRRGGRPLNGFAEPVPHDSVVRYAEEDLLLSGWATGEEHIAGQTAMARVALGDGEVVLYGFRPKFRGQPRGTYKLVFNALLNAATEN